jgi:hypothetical protein
MKKCILLLIFATTAFFANAQLITNGDFEAAVGGYTVVESTTNVLKRVTNFYDATTQITFPTLASSDAVATGQWVKRAPADVLAKGIIFSTTGRNATATNCLNLKIGINSAVAGYNNSFAMLAVQRLTGLLNDKRYVVSFWAKQDGTANNRCVGVNVVLGDNVVKSTTVPLTVGAMLTGATTWTEYTVVLDIPKYVASNPTADFTTAEFGFAITTPIAASKTAYAGVLIDDVVMTELTTPTIMYVKPVATGTGDGTSWADATDDIQTAINSLTYGEVRVAAGTYTPAATITLKTGVNLMGAYADDGSGTRDIWNNQTILDGAGTKRLLMNSFSSNPFKYTTMVNGFILQNGYSDLGSAASLSLGTVLENCIIRNNSGTTKGAAVYFSRNTSVSGSGYSTNYQNSGGLINCVVINNSSTGGSGAVYGEANTLFGLINCVIANNKCTEATTGTGGVYIGGSAQWEHLQNCILYNNSGASTNYNNLRNNTLATPVALNGILSNWFDNNSSINTSGVGNFYLHATNSTNNKFSNNIATPNFERPTNFQGVPADADQLAALEASNWRLKSTSGLIGLGNSTQNVKFPYENINAILVATTGGRAFTDISKDIMGNERIINTTVDLGAYEYNPVVVTATNGANGTAAGGITVSKGTTVTLTSSPSAGYGLSNWTNGATVVSTSPSYTFVPSGDCTIQANFITAWVISATATNGSVTGTGTINDGSSISLVATPNAGYGFVNWTEGATVVSTSATYTFNAASNRSLVANFAASTVSVSQTTRTGFAYTYNAGPSSEQSFTVAGSNLNGDITITPPTNYEISTATGGFFIGINPLTLTPSNGTLGTTTIYVRLRTGLGVANYNSENITIATTGISDQNVACSGSVNGITPTVTVTPIGTYTYTGSPQGPIAATTGGSAGAVTFSYEGTGYGPTDVLPTAAGSYTATATVAANGNYASGISAATPFTIAKVALTITAGNQSVAFGTAASTVNGAGTYTPAGFVNNETASVISGSVTYSTDYSNITTVGTSGITITPNVSGLSATNYSFTPVNGTITIVAQNNVPEVTTPINLSDLPVDAGSNLTVANNGTLTVNASPNVNSVTVDAGGKLNVTSQITVETVTLKAGKDASTFSAKLDAKITATTVRLLKTIDDTKWYFMAFPCDVRISDIRLSNGDPVGILGIDWFIKYYNGNKRATDGTSNGTNWIALSSADYTAEPATFKLNANQGYIFGLNTLISGTYERELSFPLNKNVVASEATPRSIPVTYHAGALDITNNGWNLVGQPYLSKYNAETGSNVPYMATPKGTGGYDYYSSTFHNLPTSVNPFSAYFVQADAGLQTSGLTFTLAARQAAPAAVASSLSDLVQLNVTSPGGTDFTGLIMDNDQSTSYQIGQDFLKWDGNGTQLYSILGGVNYAYNGLPMSSVNNLPIGFSTLTGGASIISVANPSQAPSLSHLWLTDSKNPGVVTDLLTSNYSFIADAGTTTNRFAITAQRVSTANDLESFNRGESSISIVNGQLLVTNILPSSTVRVFDAIGRLVVSKVANNNALNIKLPATGIYTVRIESGVNSWSKKIVNK